MAANYNAQFVPIFAPMGFSPQSPLAGLPVGSLEFERIVKIEQMAEGLDSDGVCGPNTIAALVKKDRRLKIDRLQDGHGLIMVGPQAIELWCKTKTYLDDDWDFEPTRVILRKVPIKCGVLHWDVTNSVKDTNRVLLNGDKSIHFSIAANGTLYQFHNIGPYRGIHAGSTANKNSIGLDFNNPALRKYERTKYPRDEVIAHVHGRDIKVLDFWAEQIDTFIQLGWALDEVIPFKCPRDQNNQPVSGAISRYGFFNTLTNQMSYRHDDVEGWKAHFQITDSKIDPAQLRWNEVFPWKK